MNPLLLMILSRVAPLMLSLFFLSSTVSAQEALRLGAEVPLADRVMQNANGAATSFADEMGPRGLTVIFWSSACPWVSRYEERVLALATEYMAAGVGFVAINSNDPSAAPEEAFGAMQAHMAGGGYPFPYVVDEASAAAHQFGATRAPQVFVFNSAGRLVYEGAIDDSPADARRVESDYLRNGLAAIVAGEPVRVERTRAFGCTIKPVE